MSHIPCQQARNCLQHLLNSQALTTTTYTTNLKIKQCLEELSGLIIKHTKDYIVEFLVVIEKKWKINNKVSAGMRQEDKDG